MFARTTLLIIWLMAAMMGTARAAVFYPSHFTLSNGLQVVVVPNSLAPAVSQMVWYKVGAADEIAGKTGLAHYLEHLMFRGTENVAPGEFSKIIAGQGGDDNAFTSYDYTVYYEKVAVDRLPMIMQMEADRMQNLRLIKETAEPELRVILRERQQRTDNSPEGIFMEKLQHKFMPHYPYGRPIVGLMKDVEKLSVSDVRKFYDAAYAPNNAIVVISGDVKVEDVISLAAATYGRVPQRNVLPPRDFGAAPQPQEKEFTYTDARVEQPEIVWRFVAPSYATQKDIPAYAYEVLTEVLDGGEVGILYKKLVKELDIASGVNASYDPDARGETTFALTASLRAGQSHEKLKEALRSTLNEAAKKGLNATDVEKAKQRFQRAAIFAREGLMMPGYVFGMALTTGHSVADAEAWPDRINTVSVDQVNAALRELVSSKRQIMGAFLPAPRKEAKKPKTVQPVSEKGAGKR
ncbi:MAG: pitrilysin family protein [Bdellovibrionales bacterium]